MIRKGYEKSRMWSQYGQNHEGICLVFSKKSLLEIIKKELFSRTFKKESFEWLEFRYNFIKLKKI